MSGTYGSNERGWDHFDMGLWYTLGGTVTREDIVAFYVNNKSQNLNRSQGTSEAKLRGSERIVESRM